MRFLVYQRRLMLAAIGTQLTITAGVDPAKAAELLANYLKMAIPIDPRAEAIRHREHDSMLKEVEKMAPIPLGNVRFGKALGSSDVVVEERPAAVPKLRQTAGSLVRASP
jgi:hypothetical protein